MDSLEKQISKLKVNDKVRILPNVDRERLRQMLLDSKIYLHPKKNEHFGISIVEGMAAGCIPIVHNSGGPKEFVSINQRFNSVCEAADIIERIIDEWSPIQSREVSMRTEKFGENSFSKQFIKSFDLWFN